MTGTKFFPIHISRRRVLRVLLGAWLLSPYLIWLASISSWNWPEFSSWGPSLQYAIVQAAVSAVLSLAAGWILFRARQSFSGSAPWVEMALLLPNLVPPLFLAMALLSWVSWQGAFPYGFAAVVVAHVLLNSGLVAIALDRMVQAKLGALTEAAWTLGAPPRQFIREVLWPLLRADLASIFLFVFSLCLTSFSLPLLLSGARAVSLEVAIYDAIRENGAWDKAVLLAALQSSLLLLLAWLLPQPFWPVRTWRSHTQILAWPWAWSLIFFIPLLLASGWLVGAAQGWSEGIPLEARRQILPATLQTLALALAVGLLHVGLFLWTAYVSPHQGLRRFLNGYLAPSAAITAFAFLLLPIAGGDFFKLVLALSLLSFPLLYRWLVHGALSGLQAQIQVARTMGASWSAVLFEVVWPQAGAAILRASGLAAVWAAGDFAISGILLRDLTLPLLMQELLGRYRIEAAAVLLLPLLILSFFVYFLFVGAKRYVVD